jgi:hypothetical protein
MFVSLVLVTLAVGNSGEQTGYYLQPDLGPLNIIFGYAYVLFILVMLYVFPDGRFIPGWTRWMVPVGILWGTVHLLPTPYRPFSWPYFLGILADLALYGTGIYAQIYRYRYVSNPRERQQTKWVVFGMAVAYLGLYAYYLPSSFPSPAEAYPDFAFATGSSGSHWLTWRCLSCRWPSPSRSCATAL